VPVCHKLPLSRADLQTTSTALPNPPSHDNLLFIAQLFDRFYGLLRLGELVWPDNLSLRAFKKLTLRVSVTLTNSHHSFVLWCHKSDTNFEGSRATSLAISVVPLDQIQAMGCWSSDAFRVYIQK
ncbi:hypothetical protein BDR03DRAFT_812145, partial [Suillus americanus]